MPEVKQLEVNAKENAERWKVYEETEEFREVYRKKTPDERNAINVKERGRANSLDDDEQCTVDPPQI